MKFILILLMALAAAFFLTTTAQAGLPACLADTGRDCASAPAQPDAEAHHIYLPALHLEREEEQQAAQIPVTGAADQDQRAGPPAETQHHTVRPAESLAKIARAYNTNVEALLLANPQIAYASLIYVGDTIRIPTAEEVEALRTEEALRRVKEQQRVAASVPHGGERWIDVDLRTQTVRAYQGDTLLKTFVASTGLPKTPTVTGRFRIWTKMKADDMRGPGYDLKAVPYVMYFFEDYALHGTYWHNNFGTPMSHGCVNLRTEDAAWLYDFSHVGMLVNVH